MRRSSSKDHRGPRENWCNPWSFAKPVATQCSPLWQSSTRKSELHWRRGHPRSWVFFSTFSAAVAHYAPAALPPRENGARGRPMAYEPAPLAPPQEGASAHPAVADPAHDKQRFRPSAWARGGSHKAQTRGRARPISWPHPKGVEWHIPELRPSSAARRQRPPSCT